jgi:Gly-Xaa carboxypeptidase
MRLLAAALLGLVSSATARSVYFSSEQIPLEPNGVKKDLCPLAPKVSPPADGFHPSTKFTEDHSIRLEQAERLSKVVQVPSTSTEAVTDPYDDYFAPFLDLHELLESLFPLT